MVSKKSKIKNICRSKQCKQWKVREEEPLKTKTGHEQQISLQRMQTGKSWQMRQIAAELVHMEEEGNRALKAATVAMMKTHRGFTKC